MIGNVTAATRTPYPSAAARSARPPDTPAQPAPAKDEVSVDLSPGGKLLANLSPFILDPNVHMANAEARLSELRQLLEIPPGTDIEISLSNSGQFTVKGDHEGLAKLEKMLNDGSEEELRSSLTGAHNGAMIERIAAASQRTQQAVMANPQSAESLWNELFAEADRIKNQSVDITFSGSSLSGAFADGTGIAIA